MQFLSVAGHLAETLPRGPPRGGAAQAANPFSLRKYWRFRCAAETADADLRRQQPLLELSSDVGYSASAGPERPPGGTVRSYSAHASPGGCVAGGDTWLCGWVTGYRGPCSVKWPAVPRLVRCDIADERSAVRRLRCVSQQ